MKTTWKMTCVFGMALGLLTATQAMGQVQQPGQKDPLGARQAGQKKICLASKVHGMTVKDQANQQCGQIQDLVIDESGQVQYLAISTEASASTKAPATDRANPPRTPGQQPGAKPGQAAGADATAKLTLVPFEAAEFHEGETSAQNYVSLKNIDKDKLAQAPTFSREQLTTQSQQAQWMAEVDRFYDREKSGAARPDLNKEKPDEKPDRQE